MVLISYAFDVCVAVTDVHGGRIELQYNKRKRAVLDLLHCYIFHHPLPYFHCIHHWSLTCFIPLYHIQFQDLTNFLSVTTDPSCVFCNSVSRSILVPNPKIQNLWVISRFSNICTRLDYKTLGVTSRFSKCTYSSRIQKPTYNVYFRFQMYILVRIQKPRGDFTFHTFWQPQTHSCKAVSFDENMSI